MLCELSVFHPHSSPDPFGATLSPGEGILPLLQQRDVSFFVEKFTETDCLFSGKMVFLTEIYREIGTKEETK